MNTRKLKNKGTNTREQNPIKCGEGNKEKGEYRTKKEYRIEYNRKLVNA